MLEALFDDLRSHEPDHVAVTGDLTNVALEHEFQRASVWLRELGEPSQVSIIPGNHDAYVRVDPARTWDLWAPYLLSDDKADSGGPAPTWADYPTVRRRGPIALVGLCSAQPSPPFFATGRLGEVQLSRLDRILEELDREGACRVVLIHHPPTDRHASARRRLTDFAALGSVIRRRGAELVLHGHVHRRIVDAMPGPGGPVPVVSVSSASDIGEKPSKRACYHLYEIDRDAAGPDAGWRIRVRCRSYEASSASFVDAGAEWLSGTAPP